MFAAALHHHQAGRLDQAEALYRQILAGEPRHADSLHMLGVLACQLGHAEPGATLIGRAIAVNGGVASYHFNLGNALHDLGRPAEAVECYRRSARLNPQDAGTHNNLGNALSRLGRFAEARDSFRKVIDLTPQNADAHNNLGNALRDLGQAEDAAQAYRHALSLQAGHVEALYNLGALLHDQGRFDEAASCYRRVLAIKPDLAEAQAGLGRALRGLGQVEDAVTCLRRAVELRPTAAEFHLALGNALCELGRFEDGAAGFGHALALRPDWAEAHNNLGNTLARLGRLDQAVAALARAVELRPDMAEAHSNLGNALLVRGRSEAVGHLHRALELNPALAEAHSRLGAALMVAGRLDEAAAALRRALELQPDLTGAHAALGHVLLHLRPEAAGESYRAALARAGDDAADFHRSLLYCAVYDDTASVAALGDLHRDFGARFGGRGLPATAVMRPADGRRLRIGYLSSDMRRHPVAGNMAPVIKSHDRDAFAVHIYSAATQVDQITESLRAQADDWRDVAGLSDEAVARLIRADGIDILVCLAGRFDDNRPAVCGWRAAPVQISLHDVATSGLPEMDYIIGDRWLLPAGSPEYFAERPLRLPQFYVADLPATPPPPGAARQGPAVFCCFNNPAKVSPTVLGLWGRILATLPKSRLVLHYNGYYASAELQHRVLDGLTAAGALADQVVFVTERDETDGFLARYNEVDIALDTAPFSGSTTSFHALAMGVPVVTWPWDRMVSRWSAAMLRPLGLGRLIAASGDEYVAIAVEAAKDVGAWRDRRADLRRAVAQSPLCRATGWTRHLERLYRAVWRRHLAQG